MYYNQLFLSTIYENVINYLEFLEFFNFDTIWAYASSVTYSITASYKLKKK
jgi:hypothetical protein